MASHQPDERTPLIYSNGHYRGDGHGNDDDDDENHGSSSSSASKSSLVLTEARALVVNSLPTSLGYMLQNSIQTVSVTVLSLRRDDVALSAAAHGFMLAMVTAWTLALGGTTAMDSLASVSYAQSLSSKISAAQSRHYRQQVGVLLQRCVIILLTIFVAVAILWYNIYPVLLLLDQPPAVAEEVQRFLRVLIIGAPGYILFESLKKFVQVQGDARPATQVLVVAFPLNLGLNYLFIHTLDMGLLGSPVAVSLTYYASALLLLLHITFLGSKTSRMGWGGWDLKTALRMRSVLLFTKMAVSGWIMVASEWVSFEIVALVAGSLGEVELAAQSVIMTMDQCINTLPFGLGVATSGRIGHLLGSAGDLHPHSIGKLPISAHTSFLVSTVQGLIIGLPLFLARKSFGSLFTDSTAVIKMIARVMPLVAAFQVSDGWAQSQGGVLRGIGRHEVGAAANIVAFYIISLPLGIYLAKGSPQVGLPGLWAAQWLGLTLVGLAEWAVVWRTNWRKEVQQAGQRGHTGEAGEGERYTETGESGENDVERTP